MYSKLNTFTPYSVDYIEYVEYTYDYSNKYQQVKQVPGDLFQQLQQVQKWPVSADKYGRDLYRQLLLWSVSTGTTNTMVTLIKKYN